MTFAASRHAVEYLLANPHKGLSPIKLASDAGDLAAVLLGTASLSFYATEIVFCEGESDSLDSRFYSAWFNEKQVVVQAVGSCDMVMRSVSALQSSELVLNLQIDGIIDRDFHSDGRMATLPAGVHPLEVHEVETLFCLPGVVAAVAKHLGTEFDAGSYEQSVVSAYSDEDRDRVVIERWKVRVERELGKIVSSVSTKSESLQSITAALPTIFDQTTWSVSPQTILAEEKARVENLFNVERPNVLEIMMIMPGKNLRALPPGVVGMKPSAYDKLVINALRAEERKLKQLGEDLRTALKPSIPAGHQTPAET